MAILVRFNNQLDEVEKYLGQKHGVLPLARGVEPDKIGLLTMYTAKGLEFNSVVVPRLESLPKSGAELDEEAKPLYVALTRATSNLLLTGHGRSVFSRKIKDIQAAAGS